MAKKIKKNHPQGRVADTTVNEKMARRKQNGDTALANQSKLVGLPPDPGSKTQLVQMRFRSETIERVECLKEFMETDNRTYVVAQAIRITAELATYIAKGGKVYIELPSGKQETLMVAGLVGG